MWLTACKSEIRPQKIRYGRGGSSGSGFERTKGTRSTRPREGAPQASSTNGHLHIHVVADAVDESSPRDVSQMSVRKTIKRVESQGNVPKSGIATGRTSITCSAMRDEKIDLRASWYSRSGVPHPLHHVDQHDLNVKAYLKS